MVSEASREAMATYPLILGLPRPGSARLGALWRPNPTMSAWMTGPAGSAVHAVCRASGAADTISVSATGACRPRGLRPIVDAGRAGPQGSLVVGGSAVQAAVHRAAHADSLSPDTCDRLAALLGEGAGRCLRLRRGGVVRSRSRNGVVRRSRIRSTDRRGRSARGVVHAPPPLSFRPIRSGARMPCPSGKIRRTVAPHHHDPPGRMAGGSVTPG